MWREAGRETSGFARQWPALAAGMTLTARAGLGAG